MKRMYFRGEAADLLINFLELDIQSVDEIEISITGDNEFSVWENKNGISYLIEDTQIDEVGLLSELEEFASEIEE